MDRRTAGPGAARRAADVPGPRGGWLGGNLQAFDEDRLGFLIRARQEFGDLVRFDRRTTIVNDPDLAREVLKGPDRRFQITENFVQRRLAAEQIDSMLSGRALLNPGLRRAAVVGITPLVAHLTVDAVGATRGRPVDPMPMLERVTSHAVAAYYFGREGVALPSPCGQLLDALAEVIGNPFALPATWNTPIRRRIDRLHRDLRSHVLELLTRRTLDAIGRYDDGAVAVVRGASRSADPPSPERIADLVIGAMLAAHRVPAASAAWLLMELADHPDTLDRVRQELGAVDGARTRRLEPSDVLGLRHVRACINENLRLHPPTWLLSRRAGCDLTLADWRFRKGHNFVVSPYVLGRDERRYPDPDVFHPSRWRDAAAVDLPLAFGHGPHGCPGVHLATNVLATILAVVAHRFDVERAPGPVSPDARTTLMPRGLRLTFRPNAIGAGPPRVLTSPIPA